MRRATRCWVHVSEHARIRTSRSAPPPRQEGLSFARQLDLESELLQLGGCLRRAGEISVSKWSGVGVLVSVRRPEDCLGGIGPAVDDRNRVAGRLEAVLVEECLFAECVEFSCRGPDRIWRGYVSGAQRPTSLSIQGLLEPGRHYVPRIDVA